MTTGRFREEVLNVVLALLLHERGVVAAPEQSFREAAEHRRRVPDVLVNFQGLRTVIEGKVDDQPDASRQVVAQARERVEKGIAHIAVALLYPASLREVASLPDLMTALSQTTFTAAICSEAGETGWTQGGLDYLTALLRRTLDQLIKEDVVTRAVEVLSEVVDSFAQVVLASPGAVERATRTLGIGEPPKRTRNIEPEDEE